MEDKSLGILGILEYFAYAVIGYLLGYYVIYPLLFPKSSNYEGGGCGSVSNGPVGKATLEDMERNSVRAEKLSPELKACMALGICDEEIINMRVSDNTVRKWKVEIMENASKVFEKVNSATKKSASKKKK